MSLVDMSQKIACGRLPPNDPFFLEGDQVCNMYKRLSVFDVDTEELCHKEIKNLICEVPGCGTELSSVMELELHYNSIHRYTCATCRKTAASAHLLDLHIEEAHDSYFAVQAERKPMYRCLVEDCSARFSSSQERHCHCVDDHAFPSNFRWITPKVSKSQPCKAKASKHKTEGELIAQAEASSVPSHDQAMDVDDNAEVSRAVKSGKQIHHIVFGRNTKKSFNYKNSDWHKKEIIKSSASALESAQMSTDLLSSLPGEDIS